MKAVYVKEFGGAENLEIREVDDLPKPEDAQILVKVKASALNRADILQREGYYPAPKGSPERILGLEFSGEVAEIGESVRKFQIGDRVFGITAGGAQAEFLLTEESLLAEIPEDLDFTRRRQFPKRLSPPTTRFSHREICKKGETLLIHAVVRALVWRHCNWQARKKSKLSALRARWTSSKNAEVSGFITEFWRIKPRVNIPNISPN